MMVSELCEGPGYFRVFLNGYNECAFNGHQNNYLFNYVVPNGIGFSFNLTKEEVEDEIFETEKEVMVALVENLNKRAKECMLPVRFKILDLPVQFKNNDGGTK
jgi:hypothetical protein